MSKPQVGDRVRRGAYSVRGIRRFNKKKQHVLSKYRRSDPPPNRWFRFILEWNAQGFGYEALLQAISRFKMTAKEVRFMCDYLIDYHRGMIDPPVRTNLRQPGWLERVKQRNINLKYQHVEG